MASVSFVDQEVENSVIYSAVLQNHHSKTLDIGRNGHTLSAAPLGDVSNLILKIRYPETIYLEDPFHIVLMLWQILQLSCFHPLHGIVVAAPFAQFDGNRFRDPEYVRTYRATLLDYIRSGTKGFGVQFEGNVTDLDINFMNNQWILITYTIEDLHFATTLSFGQAGEAIQSTRVLSMGDLPTDLHYKLALDVSVNRASYGQLTEGGPIPIPPSKNTLRLFEHGRSWAIINSNLDAMVEGSLYCNGQPVPLEAEIDETVALGKPIKSTFHGSLQLLHGQSCTLVSTFLLKPGTNPSRKPLMPVLMALCSKGQWRLEKNELSLIVTRNLEYILGSCTIPINKGTTCFITDHVALPLGWNRDN
jgi:hypothetical protein